MEVLHRHPNLKKLEIELETVLSHPGIEIHLGQRKIYGNQCEVQLTAKEYNPLSLLVANKDRVLTYEQIYQRVWGEVAFGGENGTIGYHISRLCGKLHEVLSLKFIQYNPPIHKPSYRYRNPSGDCGVFCIRKTTR